MAIYPLLSARSVKYALFLLTLLAVCVFAQGKGKDMAAGKAAELAGEPEVPTGPILDSFDFGFVGIDYKVYHTFTFTNKGNRTIKVSAANVPCDCSSVRFSDTLVAPGATTKVHLTFDTKNIYGKQAKFFTVATTDPATPTVAYTYTSTVGQWLYGIRPNPPGLIFLPGNPGRKLAVANPALERIKLTAADQADDYFSVKLTKPEAARGETAEVEVSPSNGLSRGTYDSSFRLRVEPSKGGPFFLTVPIKIVRY